MKPAAIGATLLLHTATIGAIFHLGTDQGSSRLQVATISLLQTGDSHPLSTSSSATKNAGFRAIPAKGNPDSALTPQVDSSAATLTDRAAPAEAGASGAAKPSEVAGQNGVSIPARYAASNRKPAYPYLSRRQEEQGTVLLRVLVTAEGRTGDVRLTRSSGYPLLDDSALAAVRDWRFQPASVNNAPVAEWYQVAIPFKLPN